MLFDLDGTLVDSFPGIASAFRHVRAEMGFGAVKDSELRPLIGPSLQITLQRHLGLTGSHLDEGVRIFREHYGTHGLFRFSKYPGVEQMLLELRDRNFDMSIATSKLRSLALAIVEHAGWGDLFTTVGGAEADGSRHLKKDVISWTLAHVPGKAPVVGMVGDRADDIVASRELGLRGIGVSWGYGSVMELDEAGAFEIVESPDQLLLILTSSLD